jgi:hypothetical protein
VVAVAKVFIQVGPRIVVGAVHTHAVSKGG